jgi:DNA-binding LacI/PurR family transcriptional regulator
MAAAQHLIDLGHSRIAFLGQASSHAPELHDRYRGATTAMRDAGFSPDPALQVDAATTEESGYNAARALLGRGVPFDAVFAASDLIAFGALRALAEAGLAVPEDVAMVGFDDIPAASLSNPPLTTIAQDYARAGQVLVDTLLRRIASLATEATMLPPRLVVRKSTTKVRV